MTEAAWGSEHHPATQPSVWTHRLRIALIAFGIGIAAATILAASGGVRGSDQYWYLADVETVVRDHAIRSNMVFPVGLLGPEPTLAPGFIHNVISIYLAALPALVLGPLGGWVALNLAATLGATVLIYLAARTVASQWAALLVALLYPVLPITIWQTSQPLVEASASLFAALAIYLLAIARTSTARWLAVVGAVGLLYASRESYLPLLLFVPVGFLVVRSREHPAGIRGAVAPSAALAGAVLVIVATVQIALGEENLERSYTRLLHMAVPGQTDNMSWYFDLSAANLADRLPIDVNLLALKLSHGLAEQFASYPSVQVAGMFWTFNILAIVAVISLGRFRDHQRRRIIIAALALVAIHFLTIVLVQNQFRYTMPALPGLLVVLAVTIAEAPRLTRFFAPRPVAIVLGIVLVTALPTALLAASARDLGVAASQTERSAAQLLDRHLDPGEPLVIVYIRNTEMLGHAALPRTILYVVDDYTTDQLERLFRAFPAHWILAPIDSQTVTTLALAPGTRVGDVEAFGRRWGLFALPE